MHTNATICTRNQCLEANPPRVLGHVMSLELGNDNNQILMSIVQRQVHPLIRLCSTSMDTFIQGQRYGPKSQPQPGGGGRCGSLGGFVCPMQPRGFLWGILM